MKVFVAGATGVLGRRVVGRLVAAGFEMTGTGRSPRSEPSLPRSARTRWNWTCSTVWP